MNLIYLNYTLCELAYQTHEEHLFEREWYINADSIKYGVLLLSSKGYKESRIQVEEWKNE